MFSLQIVDSDAFLDMPASSQLLYFHLAMRADDDGFVGNPKRILRMIGSSDDDFKILLAKRFLLSFESGVVVIKHWLIHNTIRLDRFKKTTYQIEKATLKLNEYNAYTEKEGKLATTRQPLGNHSATQVKLIESNLSKDKRKSVEQSSPTPSQLAHQFFQNPEVAKEWDLYDASEIKKFISYWTEPNKSGTRQRWQIEKTFDVKHRLGTWYERASTFNKKDGKKEKTIIEVGSLKFYSVEDLDKAKKEGRIRWDVYEKKYIQIT